MPARCLTPLSLRRKTTLVLVSSIAVLLASPLVHAATRTFDGGTSGTGTALDTNTNWVGDVLPITTDEVLFDNSVLGTLAAQLTTTGASATYGDLIWNTNNSSTITINTTGSTSRTITLSGGGGGTAAVTAGGNAADLLVMGTLATSNTLTIGGNANSGDGRLNLIISKAGNFDVVNAGATLNLTAAVSGEFSLTKTGAGTLVLSAANTFGVSVGNSATSTFTISAGKVQLSGAGTLGSQLNDLAVNGSLDLNDTSQTVDALSGSGSIFNNGSGTSTLTIGYDFGGTTFSGVISSNTNAGTGVMALTKIGTGTATISTTQTYSGATTVNLGYVGNLNGAGTLALSNSTGRLTNSAVTINGATLTMTNNAAGMVTRASSVSLNNATMTLAGTSVGNTVDAITNALNLASGRSTITLTPNSARNTQLAAGSFTRGAGATALVRGTGLGANTIASATINSVNVTFTSAPVLSGSGTVGTSTVGILPWAYGDSSATGTGSDFLTYDATFGLRRLISSEYVTTFASGNSALDNAKITGAIGAINTATALNSLTLGSSGRVNGTGTLTISSGGVLAVDNASIGTLAAGTLDFGAAEGILTAVAGRTLTVASAITGTGGLTTGGAGTVALTGTNSYTGGTYLSGGTLSINDDAALGSAATNLIFSGGTLQAGAGNVTVSSARSLSIANVSLNAFFDAPTATVLSIAGTTTGAGGVMKTGLGTVSLSGTSSFTGSTYAAGGTVTLAGSLANTSSLVISGGEAKLDFSAATAPGSNIVNSAAPLILNIGPVLVAGVNTLTVQGKDDTANTQTFNGTNFANFASHINLTPGSGTGTLTVNLGAIGRITSTNNNSTRANPGGATLDITIPTGVTVTGSSSTTGGIIIGATVNGSTWATISSGNVVGTTAYSSTFSTTSNFDATTSGNLTSSPNSIRFNTGGAVTVTLSNNNPRALASGGILVTSNVGANLSRITGGILQGIGRRDIIFIQNNTAGDLQVDSVITDLGGTSNGLTKSGLGKLILTANNTISAAALINEGTLVAAGDYVPAVNLTGSVNSAGTLITLDSASDMSTLYVGKRVTNSTAMNSAGVSTTWVITALDTVEQDRDCFESRLRGSLWDFLLFRWRRTWRQFWNAFCGRRRHAADWQRWHDRFAFPRPEHHR